ncbi:glucosamine-6-phosphate deaminase, partial [Agrococcus casei]|uniref:glucosamine-6-phosphate deaminase n=1 Tax=Agrococcus casei TaxID=343512 RepID=UPI003F9183D3
RALATLIRSESIAVDGVRAFALDEYVGLPAGHPEGYASVVAREVVQPLGLNPQLVRVPNGEANEGEASCADYEAAIREAGGVDLQLLGIGSTGHIGFNEPGSAFDSRTRVTELAESTRRDNARFFDSIDDVPTHAATQGIGTILEARQLVLLAFGESKAQAVARAVEGPVTEDVPASALQLHPHATIVIDEAAASLLQGR